MEVKRHQPHRHKTWEITPQGARRAELYLVEGLVSVYSFPGDQQHRAFTQLEIWISPHVYRVTLPRHYHDRWIMRIASDFAWAAQIQANAGEVRS